MSISTSSSSTSSSSTVRISRFAESTSASSTTKGLGSRCSSAGTTLSTASVLRGKAYPLWGKWFRRPGFRLLHKLWHRIQKNLESFPWTTTPMQLKSTAQLLVLGLPLDCHKQFSWSILYLLASRRRNLYNEFWMVCSKTHQALVYMAYILLEPILHRLFSFQRISDRIFGMTGEGVPRQQSSTKRKSTELPMI